MDDSPADADSQPGSLPPYPYRAPDGEQRPLPDAVAIRLVAIPDFNPPFDDELPGAWNPGLRVNQVWAGNGPAPHMPNMNDELVTGQYGPYSAAWSEVRTTNHHRTGDPLPMWKPACERATEPTAGHQAPGHQASGHHQPPGQEPADEQPSGKQAPGDRRSGGRDNRDGDGDGDDIGPWPSQFAQVLAETLAGARPASQLTPWTTEQARTHIRRLGPLLAAERRPRVQRVRASRPARNVVEVAVIAEFGSRTRALAARLERAGAEPATPGRRGREARWLCTAIESA